MNKQGLAFFQTATIKDVVPDGKRGFRQGGCIFHGKVVRHWQAQGGVGDRIFRITPAMDQRANPVARYRELKITIGFDDLAGNFKSGDFRCAGWRRVPAQALHHVRAIDPCGADFYQHLPRSGGWYLSFGDGQYFGSARFLYDYIFHYKQISFVILPPETHWDRLSADVIP